MHTSVMKMVRRWMVLAVLGFVALSVPYIVTASGPGGECHAEGDGYGEGTGGQGSGGATAEERMCMKAEQAHMFGMLQEESENGIFSGRFIEFSLAGDRTALSDYTFKVPEEAPLIESVYWGEVTGATYALSGAHFRLTSEEVLVDVHNNLAAIMMVRVRDTREVVYDLPEGVTYTEGEGVIDIDFGGLEGVMMYVNATVSASDGTLTFTPIAAPYHVIFRVAPSSGVAGCRWEQQYTEALRRGKGLGEMRIAMDGGEHMVNQFAYREDVRMTVKEASRNRVRIEVSGEGEGGVMLIQMNREALGERVRLYLDGEKVKEAGEVEDVVEATGDEPLYTTAPLEDGSQYLAVYIPHFSTHTIEILSGEEERDYTLPLIAAGIAIILIVAAAILLRRRK